MALINKVENTATIVYDGATLPSNTVTTLLLLKPTIVKTVDLPTASIGSVLTYTIVITNLALQPITNLPFSDAIPEGTEYVPNSFTVNTTSVTPTIKNNVLTYTIPTVGVGVLGLATITFQVKILGNNA